jgi:hypothetical protein
MGTVVALTAIIYSMEQDMEQEILMLTILAPALLTSFGIRLV